MANQGTFTAGQVLTAAELNAFTQVTALADYTNLSIPNATATNLTFTSEIIDVGGWHSTTTNTDRITPNVAGIYLVTAASQLNITAGSIFAETAIRKNGTIIVSSAMTAQGFYPGTVCSIVTNANGTTDYFTANSYQNSGGALDVFRRSFSCVLLRAT